MTDDICSSSSSSSSRRDSSARTPGKAANTSDPDHPRATIYRQSGMTPPFVGVKMANTRDLAVLSLCPRSCDSSHYAHIGSLTLGGACQCSLITPSSVQRVTLQVCFYFTSPAAAFLIFSNCENILVLKWLKDFSKENIPFIIQE